jgi:hypothetical protein
MKNAYFWDVAPCGFIVNRRFGGKCGLHPQGRRDNQSDELTDYSSEELKALIITLEGGRGRLWE